MMTKSVSQLNRRKGGFTLIELLVVIAIITLLLSVLMPALKKAKELGKRAVCLNHARQLTISWKMYADDNEEWIPQASVDKNSTEYGWVAQAQSNSYQHQVESIENGVLFPYTGSLKVYQCPTSVKDGPRSYSIVSSMNSPKKSSSTSKGNVYNKLTKIPLASDMFVFICEGKLEENDNAFNVKHDTAAWGDDLPPLRHSNGTVFSYVDGHSESLAWQDKRTIKIASGDDKDWTIETILDDSIDLQRVQRGVWGSLGYSPQQNP